MATSYNRIQAVSTTVAILRHLSAQREPVSGQEVAKAVKVPHGTAMCHLATLEDEGFVQSIGGAYKLGMGLALLWARTKSNLEGERDRISRDIESISIEGDK